MDLFSVEGNGLDAAYALLKTPSRLDVAIRTQIEEMWARCEPFADSAFAPGFARDVEGRFWEMYLSCFLLDEGYQLLPDKDRASKGGQPDICVIEGDRRIWIEAISVTEGAEGPDRVVHPLSLNEGGGFTFAPTREAQLRITGAFQAKAKIMTRYLDEGVVRPSDVRVIAINVSRFATLVSEKPLPLIVRCLFPIGKEYSILNLGRGEVTHQGHRHAPIVEKSTGPIATDSFLDAAYAPISGVVYSRIGLGSLDRKARPITFVHNPHAQVPLDQGWGTWDREFVARQAADGEGWELTDARVSDEP